MVSRVTTVRRMSAFYLALLLLTVALIVVFRFEKLFLRATAFVVLKPAAAFRCYYCCYSCQKQELFAGRILYSDWSHLLHYYCLHLLAVTITVKWATIAGAGVVFRLKEELVIFIPEEWRSLVSLSSYPQLFCDAFALPDH